MKKLLRIIIIVSILVIQLLPLKLDAASYQDVTVVANPSGSGGITAFTITYINDNQLDMEWTTWGDVANVMIRADFGRYPSDIPDEDTTPSDGYLVYYGSGSSTSDTSVMLGDNLVNPYYKVWAQKADGKWHLSPASDFEENTTMYLLAFIVLALGLTIGTFVLKTGRRILAFASAGAWIVLSAFSYVRSEQAWDVYYALFMFAAIMTFAMALVPAVLREKKEIEITAEEADEQRNMKLFNKDEQMLYQDMLRDKRERQKDELLFGRRKKRTNVPRLSKASMARLSGTTKSAN